TPPPTRYDRPCAQCSMDLSVTTQPVRPRFPRRRLQQLANDDLSRLAGAPVQVAQWREHFARERQLVGALLLVGKVAQAVQVGDGPTVGLDGRQVVRESGHVVAIVPARRVRTVEAAAEGQAARPEVRLPDRRIRLPWGQEAAEGVVSGEDFGD